MHIERREFAIPLADMLLRGHASLPPAPRGVVLCLCARGHPDPLAAQLGPRLHAAGVATVTLEQMPALPAGADATAVACDVDALGMRLLAALRWLEEDGLSAGLPVGCFGSGPAAAVALAAAARQPIAAVVAHQGLPELAGDALGLVTSPSLLIVDAEDEPMVEANRQAVRRLLGPARLGLVPGAAGGPGEAGERTALRLATDWFRRHLVHDHDGGSVGGRPSAQDSPRGQRPATPWA